MAQEVITFVYHRFGEDRYPSTNISLQNFKEQLEYLKSTGHPVLTISNALAFDQEQAYAITIDDGYKSFFTHAYPMLKEMGFSATIYVNTESVGKAGYMNWDELRQLVDDGFELGNHSHAHEYFLNIPSEDRYAALRRSVQSAQQIFRDQLGIAPRTFAYPYGEFDEKMKQTVASLGFKAALAQNSGVIHAQAGRFSLPRFPMTDRYANSFKEKANMHALPVESIDIVSRGTLRIQLAQNAPKRLNCFSASVCQVSRVDDQQNVFIISAEIPARRRVLQTITGQNNGWYWFSYLWVNPNIPE